MANTFVKIASSTISVNTASVTFSSISSAYTDLVLLMSLRSNQGGNHGTLVVQAGSANGNYSWIRFVEQAGLSTPYAGSTQVANDWTLQTSMSADSNLANIFSSHSLYIPNYAGSLSKPAHILNDSPGNATPFYMTEYALLKNNTAAISEILIACGNEFVAGSMMVLYGIKNT